MWTELIKWPGWDYTFKVAGFVASLITIIGVASIIAAVLSFYGDRRRRREERRERRRTLLVALQVETISIIQGVAADLARFDLKELDGSIPAKVLSKTEMAEYQRAFVWTPLPMAMFDDVLREPYLLSLDATQIGNLAALRSLIQTFNAFVNTMASIVGARTTNPSVRADQNVDLMNTQMRSLLDRINETTKEIQKWTGKKLEHEPMPGSP